MSIYIRRYNVDDVISYLTKPDMLIGVGMDKRSEQIYELCVRFEREELQKLLNSHIYSK
jgi:hypothetical protein